MRETDLASRPLAAPQLERRLTYSRLKRLTLKELREILRDRRTVVTLFLMPLLLYPMLSMAFNRFLISTLAPGQSTTLVVGVDSQETAKRLADSLSVGDQLLKAKQAERVTKEEEEPDVQWRQVGSLRRALANVEIDLGVFIVETPAPPDAPSGAPRRQFELIYRENSVNSGAALRYIEARLEAVNEAYLRMRFGDGVELPAKVRRSKVHEVGGSSFSLATIVPLILILMTITGAVYPAIDLTAGERERGTLETLIAAPVPRFGLLLAKYVAVLTVAMLTATVNLMAMMATIFASGMASAIFDNAQFSWYALLQIFALLAVFAAFFSAVLLTLTSMARSFKEAQAYLVPLMLVSLAPGIFGIMPGLEFNGILAVTPLVNIVLLSRDMLEGNADPTLATVAIFSTAVYTVAAVALAARVFGGDAVMYGSQESWKDLLRRPNEPRAATSVTGAMLCLAVIFPLHYAAISIIPRMNLSTNMSMVLASVATPFLFGLIPWLSARFFRVDLREGFALKRASLFAFLGAVFLGLSVWPFAQEIVLYAQKLGFGGISEDHRDKVDTLIASWRLISPVVVLFAFAALPAVFEELFFRGYLFSALEKNLSPYRTVLISALLFGVFHVVDSSMLAVERLLPSTFMGLVLGFVRIRTRSVIPSILLHALHNGFLLSITYYRDDLMQAGWGLEHAEHLPYAWLATAAATSALGVLLVYLGTRGPAGQSSPSLKPAT